MRGAARLHGGLLQGAAGQPRGRRAPDGHCPGAASRLGSASVLERAAGRGGWASPPGRALGGLVRGGGDGRLYVSTDNGLWARPDETSPWQEVTLPLAPHRDLESPEEVRVADLWVRAPGDLWLLMSERATIQDVTVSLYHSRPPSRPADLPSMRALRERLASNARPADSSCIRYFARQYELDDHAPDGPGYPKTWKALRGTSLSDIPNGVEYEQQGRRYFGIDVFDEETGRKIVERVRAGVPGSSPALECRVTPEGQRVERPSPPSK